MPLLGFGTWRADAGLVGPAVAAALAEGYRHFDGAAVYANEAQVGAALRQWMESPAAAEAVAASASSDTAPTRGVKRTPRSELFVTNKLWNTFHAPSDVADAARRSLACMQLDYFDLYLVHWPVCFQRTIDPLTGQEELYPKAPPPAAAGGGGGRRRNRAQPMRFAEPDISLEETWAAMLALKAQGLARDVGLSNCTSGEVLRICAAFPSPRNQPSVNQVEAHPLCAQHSMQAILAAKGVHVSAYSPLGNIHAHAAASAASLSSSSSSTAAASSKAPPPPLSPLHHPVIQSLAATHGVSPAQVLLRWNLQLGRSVLPKSVQPHRIQENARLFHFELSDHDMRQIAHLNQPASQHRFLNPTSFKREPRKYFFTAFE